jgi:hypothetical protein
MISQHHLYKPKSSITKLKAMELKINENYAETCRSSAKISFYRLIIKLN